MGAISAQRLHFSDFVAPPGWFHAARTRYHPAGGIQAHSHDFAEAFWIEAGHGTHALNGESQRLRAGSVRFIGERDVHGIRSSISEGLVIVNVAFPSRLLADLLRRFPPGEGYAWQKIVHGKGGEVPEGALRELTASFARLVRSEQRRLQIERFLLEVASTLEEASRGAGRLAEAPAWFAQSVSALADSASMLAEGAPAFIRVCGRVPDHVNRVARRYLQCTTTDLVNGARLEAAALMLRTSDTDILSVALEIGFANLSYFYRRFRDRFGLTPRRYREREHRLVLTPGGGTRDPASISGPQ